MRYQRQQRTLRKKIEADPEAFFTQADADCSKDLSRDEWGKICRAFVEDVEHDPARALFEEIAQGRDTISRASFFHVADEYRQVRRFVETSECTDMLVDGLISWVLAKRSKLPPPETEKAGHRDNKAEQHEKQDKGEQKAATIKQTTRTEYLAGGEPSALTGAACSLVTCLPPPPAPSCSLSLALG